MMGSGLNADVVHNINLHGKGISLPNVYEKHFHSSLSSSNKCNRSFLFFINDYRQKER